MSRNDYIKIILIVLIFLFVNSFPFGSILGDSIGLAPDSDNISMDLYPEEPYNVSLLGTDTTFTVRLRNEGLEKENFTLDVFDRSKNLFINGRDGLALPARERIGAKENNYYSFALMPSTLDHSLLDVIVKVSYEGERSKSIFRLKVLWPKLGFKEIERISVSNGLSENIQAYLVPKYRRYWHPERSELGKAEPGYVWLVVGENSNILIDDVGGSVVASDVKLPWNVSAPTYGSVSIWTKNGFEERIIPAVEVNGDVSYNREEFELYFAGRENNPAWVSRRIFYWTSENLITGSWDEVPDTERVEMWISAENGRFLSTLSDYHHHAFRYDPVEEYTIQDYYHCPVPRGLPLQWTNFAVVNYKKVYPLADVAHDHLGYTEKIHPVDEAIARRMPLIRKNLVGILLAVLVFLLPFLWKKGRRLPS